jgi:CBS-domain-containing membrane protein
MKRTPVARVSELSTMKALILPEDTPILEAIDRFASNEGQHGIFLTQENGRLIGVVNNRDLMDWARLQFDVIPGDLPLPVGKVRRLITATCICDLAAPDSKQMSVKLSDTLADALAKMATYELDDIAVVDDKGQVVNDLRLSEVLSFALRVNRGQSS